MLFIEYSTNDTYNMLKLIILLYLTYKYDIMDLKLRRFSYVVASWLCLIPTGLEAQTQPIHPTEAAAHFNVFTAGEAIAVKTESEGAWAVGGDFTLDGNLNIFGGVDHYNGDAQATALVVDGKVNYVSGRLQILQNNYVKIADLSSSTIFELDPNQVITNTRITSVDGHFDSTPNISLSTSQSASSITADPLLDFEAAFATFETVSAQIGSLDSNVSWNLNAYAQGKLWLDLVPQTTNVINFTAAEFNALQEIKFNTLVPSATTPLVINITDVSANPEVVSLNSWPNIVGSPLSYAPYILYNFAEVQSTLEYTGGAQMYGTIYAPKARFNNRSQFNIDGQIIVAAFEQNSGEVHPLLFDTVIEFPPFNAEEICDGIDNNGDGLIDEDFADTDGDGLADCIDNCPETPNPDQLDVDANGIGDACEVPEVEEICDGIDNNGDGFIDEGFGDIDADGVADCVDNCIYTYNPDQADFDGDGLGDVCGGGATGPYYRSAFSVDVYPIPYEDVVHFSHHATVNTNATIEVFDMNGRVLKRVVSPLEMNAENEIISISLKEFSKESPVLFVRFTTDEGTVVKRIISH